MPPSEPDPQSPPAVRPHFAALSAYEPVVPMAERARLAGIDPADALKLDANENPFGMHPQVRDALQGAMSDRSFGSIYPDPNQQTLRAALSDYTGAATEQIIAGAGADELLDLCLRALLEPGDALITAPPSFGMYPFLAAINQLRLVEIKRGAGFALPREALLDAARRERGIVVLTSPNNPSGDLSPLEFTDSLLETGATVMLDEAYIEFAGFERSAVGLLREYPRLIIVRTFSKWAGIAGLRLGYALAHPSLVADLFKLKQPYNLNATAETAGLAALAASDGLLEQAAQLRTVRDDLIRGLMEIDGLRPLPSDANFVLIEVDLRLGTGRDLHDALAQRGVFTRAYSDPRLANYLRISAPRPDQLAALLARIQSAAA